MPVARAAVLTVVLVATLLSAGGGSANAGGTTAEAVVRINQVGFADGEPVVAHVMTTTAAPDAAYELRDDTGDVVASGAMGPDTGRWSARWPHVYRVSVAAVDIPGSYQFVVTGSASGTSPIFSVGTAKALYAPLAANGVRFFQVQRDGADQVPGVMRRKRSHLADRNAQMHKEPRERHQALRGPLKPISTRANLSGGWFDAGDYLKFVETTSYADALLLVATRDAARPVPGLRSEALYGARWLDRAWRDRSKTLIHQVGVGEGVGRYLGDHDVWRLPQADDRLKVQRTAKRYYLKHRPAFVTGDRRTRISPNLAGRTAASFALAAQVLAPTRKAKARSYLGKARAVLARAKTRNVGRLTTTSPYAYYEEDEWRDDMELGATEIALAGQALRVPPAQQRADLRRAARWAAAYFRSPRHGWYTFARDDQSALAHADLVRAMTALPGLQLKVTRTDLTRDLAAQLRIARDRYAAPLGYGGDENPGADFAFGAAVTEQLYRRATGDTSFSSVGRGMRDWALGANAWGTSTVIGAGTTYPRCPHHQIANILRARSRTAPELLGAVSNGPADASSFKNLGAPGAYARPCATAGNWRAFDGQGVRYLDDVRAWAATEPGIDYAAIALLHFVLAATPTP